MKEWGNRGNYYDKAVQKLQKQQIQEQKLFMQSREIMGIFYRKCRYCKKEYIKNYKYSISQWSNSKYCSAKCAAESRKTKDEYKDKHERYRRKKGSLKQGSPMWLERIRETTKMAMASPEVREKLHKSRIAWTEERKAVLSQKLAGKMPKNVSMFRDTCFGEHFHRGMYQTSKGEMYFRSKWEANIALYLDFLVSQKQIKKWEYEAEYFVFERIRHGTTRYLPDFKITNNNETIEYWEIKGFMDSRSKTKLKRMAKYYPETKLILVERKQYEDIKRKMGKMLKFY